MSLAKHLWNALLELAEVVGGLEGNDGANVDGDVDQTCLSSCSAPRLKPGRERDATRYGGCCERNGQHFVGVQGAENNYKSTGSEGSVLEPDRGAGFKDRTNEFRSKVSNVVIGTLSLNITAHTIDQVLRTQNENEISKQESVAHLKWQDKASTTIKELKEQVHLRTHQQRTTKQAAFREKAAMRRRIADLGRHIRELEREKVQMVEEGARVSKAHGDRLQEARQELEAQREEARQAAVAAQDRCSEHVADMRMAGLKIEELRAAQTFTFSCRREVEELRGRLDEVEREKREDLAVKEEEVEKLRDGIEDRDATIQRLRDEVKSSRQAYEEAMREKARLHRGKMEAEGKVDRLRTKNEDLMSKKEEVEARASGAEGRAKGLQDQLTVARKREDHWRTLYTDAVEDARDRILSAYAVPGPLQNTEEDSPRSTETAFSEVIVSSSDSVEALRKENSKLQEQMVRLKREWREAWEKAVQDQKTWQQTVHRECEEERREALLKARAANDLEQRARERDLRRRCEEEKRTALTAERERCWEQWEMKECELRAQLAAASKVKMTCEGRERRGKLRRNRICGQGSKVEKGHLRRVFGRAVSRAVEVERRLSERRLRSECQFCQKTRFESELAESKGGPEEEAAQKAPPASIDPVLRDEEIRKRDEYIAAIEARLETAHEEKRAAQRDLENVRSENERLSRDIATCRDQESMMKRNGGGWETQKSALMLSDFARALELLDEVATMGLDDNRHRHTLTELLLANKVVREIRCSIEKEDEEQEKEGGERVHLDDVENKLDCIILASDHVEDPDPATHPALHAQLAETYSVVGGLLNILMGTRGESTKGDLLGRICGEKVRGFEAAAGRSAAETTISPNPPNETHLLLPNHQTSLSTDATATLSTSNNTTAPLAPPRDEAEDMDPATAHALQGMDEFDPDSFDLGSIDWSDPTIRRAGAELRIWFFFLVSFWGGAKAGPK